MKSSSLGIEPQFRFPIIVAQIRFHRKGAKIAEKKVFRFCFPFSQRQAETKEALRSPCLSAVKRVLEKAHKCREL
jgi:hypothetical protein